MVLSHTKEWITDLATLVTSVFSGKESTIIEQEQTRYALQSN